MVLEMIKHSTLVSKFYSLLSTLSLDNGRKENHQRLFYETDQCSDHQNSSPSHSGGMVGKLRHVRFLLLLSAFLVYVLVIHVVVHIQLRLVVHPHLLASHLDLDSGRLVSVLGREHFTASQENVL